MQTTEGTLRRSLGIPDDAQHVIIFAESSHWDPDWLYTAEEYYSRLVRRNLDQAIAALEREPRRIYSVECMFFLRMYWDRRPEKREAVRRLVNERRLRLTNCGVTTADTLLPSTESLLRDFLIGQEWLRRNGMTEEPRLAYFTDSFGCSPALPSLLVAAGFNRTAITRVDGMYFGGADLESARSFRRPGSTAALLQAEKAQDFIWRDMNGAEVLCHWNAFGYGMGDMLAHRGISRMYILPVAVPVRSEPQVARRIEGYAQQLGPLSRTPYLFCPIGFDFVPPIPGLVALLDRYNRVRYPTTGIWAVNAGLDNYLALVECHREKLPVLRIDPNPYWTGFYTSRPALKKACRDLADRLLLAEQLALAPEQGENGPAALAGLEEAWWIAAMSNHHDFITGTSPDRVAESEQLPWVAQARGQADAVINKLSPAASADISQQPDKHGNAAAVTWQREGSTLWAETPHYKVELSERAGGGITHLVGKTTDDRQTPAAELLSAISNDLIAYRDSGGLWRMGHEFRGGRLRERSRASRHPAAVKVREVAAGLEVVCQAGDDGRWTMDDDGRFLIDRDAASGKGKPSASVRARPRPIFNGEPIQRALRFSDDSPLIRSRVEGRAPRGETVCLVFHTGLAPAEIAMAQPGGVVIRPLEKHYCPTFWPMQDFAHIRDRASGRGIAVFTRYPSAIACAPDGRIELVAFRNATHERAWGFISPPAFPAKGAEKLPYAFDYALRFTSDGDWRGAGVHRIVRELAATGWWDGAVPLPTVAVVTRADGSPCDVTVSAVKPAGRGEGVIVRLSAPFVPEESLIVTLRDRSIQAAWLCDARERDLAALAVRDGRALLTMPGTIATMRLQHFPFLPVGC